MYYISYSFIYFSDIVFIKFSRCCCFILLCNAYVLYLIVIRGVIFEFSLITEQLLEGGPNIVLNKFKVTVGN